MSTSSAVKVFLRFRNNTTNNQDAVQFRSNQQIKLHSSHCKKPVEYSFDRIWSKDSVQGDVYKQVGEPLLKNILDGYNSTLFVYGQTGSGKTYTMFGPDGGKMGSEKEGIVPRAMRDLFRATSHLEKKNPGTTYSVSLNIVDIYLERVRDLLCKNLVKNPEAQNMKVRWHKKTGVYITYADRSPCTSTEVKNYEEIQNAIDFAMKVRRKSGAQAATKMNAYSSRSHFVIILTLVERSPEGIKTSKLLMIDLAGSEKTKNSGATGTTLKQAQNINYGLSVLGNVLNALTAKERRLPPFADSKLTKILQDSLGGNCKTALICGLRPDDHYALETKSTIRFGLNARKIRNQVFKNETLTPAQYRKRIAKMNSKNEALNNAIGTLQKQQVLLTQWIDAIEEDYTTKGGDIDALAKSKSIRRASEILKMQNSDIASNSESEEKTDIFGRPSLGTISEGPAGSGTKGLASKFLKSMNKKLANENSHLTEDIEDLRAQLRSTEQLVRTLEGENDDYSQRVEELEARDVEMKNMHGRNYELSRALKHEQQMNKHLDAALKAKNNTEFHLEKNIRVSSIAAKIANSDSKLLQLQAALKNQEDGVLMDLVSDLTDQQSEIAKLKKALTAQTEHNKQLMLLRQETCKSRTGTEKNMLALYSQYKEESKNNDIALEAKDAKIARLEALVDELKNQRESMREQIGRKGGKKKLSIAKALSDRPDDFHKVMRVSQFVNGLRPKRLKKKPRRKIKNKPPTLSNILVGESSIKNALVSPLA